MFVTSLFKGIAMLKKLGMLSALCLTLLGCQYSDFGTDEIDTVFQQPNIKVPNSIVVCRAKQCAPARLSMSKEYIYNTLLHMFDSNARRKALICAADPNTHACTENYISVPITVGITPAYMYVDDVKITDVSISKKSTSAFNLILNWNVSYNGQTPVCRPSKTLLYAKNIDNVIMEDNGYTCKMTTIGTSTIKTLFAIDYIDLDYGYIGGFYSIGLSGPAFGGGAGYMMLRLPEEITLDPKDFMVDKDGGVVRRGDPYVSAPQPIPAQQKDTSKQGASVQASQSTTVPNVDTIIKYNHPSKDYDNAKAAIAKKKKEDAEALNYEGVKVFPVASTNKKPPVVAPKNKNVLTDYREYK